MAVSPSMCARASRPGGSSSGAFGAPGDRQAATSATPTASAEPQTDARACVGFIQDAPVPRGARGRRCDSGRSTGTTPALRPAVASRLWRRWWFWALSGVFGLIVVLAILVAAVIPLSADNLRHRMIATLSERLESDVEIGDLHLHVFPALHVEGSKLIVRWRGRTDVPPLISIAAFTVDANLLGL